MSLFHPTSWGVNLPVFFIILGPRRCHLGGTGLVFTTRIGRGWVVLRSALKRHQVIGGLDALLGRCCKDSSEVPRRKRGGLGDWHRH